jgi:hypothetical protein
MIVICPHCGSPVPVNGLGRKPLNIPLKNVLEFLRIHRNVAAAAKELGCSPSYVFGVLKKDGLKLNEVIKGSKCLSGSAGAVIWKPRES